MNKIEKHIKEYEEKVKSLKEKVVEYEEKIKKLKEKLDIINELQRRGVNYSLTDFKKILEKEKSIQEELSNLTYKAINVGGKIFFITDKGDIYSRTRKYKTTLQVNGYKTVSLNNEVKYVHRIVWEAFMGEIPEGMEIDHIIPISDGGTNELSNLRLVSPKQNKHNPLTIAKYKISNKNKGIVRMRTEKK